MNIFIGLQKNTYKDFFKISKLELLLISLGSEFQNLVADIWNIGYLSLIWLAKLYRNNLPDGMISPYIQISTLN